MIALGIGLAFLLPTKNTSTAQVSIEEESTLPFLKINYSEVNLPLDERYKVEYIILPIEDTPKIVLEGTTLASVENLTIYPLKVGSTKVKLIHKNLEQSFILNIYNKEINITFNSNNFISGKDENDSSFPYTATILPNFEYTYKTIKLSDNIEVTNSKQESNKIILNFSILSGDSFTISVTLDETHFTKTYVCEPYIILPEEIIPEDPVLPPEPETPNEELPQEEKEDYSYKLYYNGEEITGALEVRNNKIVIIEYKLYCDDEEVEFLSSFKIQNSQNIKGFTTNHKQFSFITTTAGKVKITLCSKNYDIYKTIEILILDY